MSSEVTNRAEQMSAYTNSTRVSARHAVALSIQLERAAPADLSADERATLEEVSRRAREVRDVREQRERLGPTALRDQRNATSVSWTSVYDSLVAVTNIAPEVGDDAARAKAVLDLLFADGTGFTRLDAAGLWDRTDSLLARIDELHLASELGALVNPRLLSNVRYAFERLSRAVQVSGEVRPTVAKNAQLEANARFSFALAKYARALSVRVSVDDDAAFERFLSALAPIDAMRITPGSAAEADEDEGTDEPDTDEPVTDEPDTDTDPVPEPFAPGPFVTEE